MVPGAEKYPHNGGVGGEGGGRGVAPPSGGRILADAYPGRGPGKVVVVGDVSYVTHLLPKRVILC